MTFKKLFFVIILTATLTIVALVVFGNLSDSPEMENHPEDFLPSDPELGVKISQGESFFRNMKELPLKFLKNRTELSKLAKEFNLPRLNRMPLNRHLSHIKKDSVIAVKNNKFAFIMRGDTEVNLSFNLSYYLSFLRPPLKTSKLEGFPVLIYKDKKGKKILETLIENFLIVSTDKKLLKDCILEAKSPENSHPLAAALKKRGSSIPVSVSWRVPKQQNEPEVFRLAELSFEKDFIKINIKTSGSIVLCPKREKTNLMKGFKHTLTPGSKMVCSINNPDYWLNSSADWRFLLPLIRSALEEFKTDLKRFSQASFSFSSDGFKYFLLSENPLSEKQLQTLPFPSKKKLSSRSVKAYGPAGYTPGESAAVPEGLKDIYTGDEDAVFSFSGKSFGKFLSEHPDRKMKALRLLSEIFADSENIYLTTGFPDAGDKRGNRKFRTTILITR